VGKQRFVAADGKSATGQATGGRPDASEQIEAGRAGAR
jgi:hypothetical protein